MVQADVPGKPTAEIACQVVNTEAPEHLTYSWTDLRGDQNARWLVDWKLKPQGRGTRVFFRMSGFDLEDRRQKFARNGLEANWDRTALPYLAEVVNELTVD